MILAVGKEDEEQLKYSIGLNVGLPTMLVLPVPGCEVVGLLCLVVFSLSGSLLEDTTC